MNDESQPTTPIDGATPTAATATTAETATVTAAETTPRIRWAGVIWGALFCAFGVVVMVVLSSTDNRMGFTSWIDGLGPAGAGIVGAVAVGALVLIFGILGAAGRVQRSR